MMVISYMVPISGHAEQLSARRNHKVCRFQAEPHGRRVFERIFYTSKGVALSNVLIYRPNKAK